MKLEEFFAGAAAGCQEPGCTHPHEEVVMHGACHKDTPTWMTVDAKKRTITISCSKCDKKVATIECPFVN